MEKIGKYALYLFLLFPSILSAQIKDSIIIIKDTVVVRKQLQTEEVVYEELTMSGTANIFLSPIFLPNFPITNLSDGGLYNNSHYPGESFLFGVDYSLELASYFIKAGLGFSYLKEYKIFDTNLPPTDTTYIASDSYIVTYNDNVRDLVSSNYFYINFPISFGKIFSIGKFTVRPEIGAQFDILLYAYGYNGARLEEVFKISNKMIKPVKSNILIANAFVFPLKEKMSFYLQPWFAFALNPEYNESYSIPSFNRHSWGLKLGLALY